MDALNTVEGKITTLHTYIICIIFNCVTTTVAYIQHNHGMKKEKRTLNYLTTNRRQGSYLFYRIICTCAT